MTRRIAKLIMVSGEVNSNKFYNMTDDGTTIHIEYGRIDSGSPRKTSKPSSHWDKIYREKTRKGYVDQTRLFAEKIEDSEDTQSNGKFKEFLDTRKKEVISIVKKLQSWATDSIKQNYSIESKDVTQAQVDEAQTLIDEMSTFDFNTNTKEEFNEILLRYFMTVPRKMKRVQDNLLKGSTPQELSDNRNKLIGDEQDTLDVMAGQVKLDTNITTPNTDNNQDSVVDTDIIDKSGLSFDLVEDQSIIDLIKEKMQTNASQFKQAFEVRNVSNKQEYDEHVKNAPNKKTELFWHGSRNENWWSIITTNLKIRPSNAVHTGSMFGDSIYFANKFRKSYGYTSGRGSYWARGSEDIAILGLYEVHVGNQKHIYKHDSSCYSLNYDKIQKEGFDSVYAHGGIDLINDEFMVYNSKQCTLNYLVVVSN